MNPLAWDFVHEERVHLIWLALAIVGGLIGLELRGRGALGALLSPVMQRRLVVAPSLARAAIRIGLVAIALIAGVLALMRPQGRGETVQVGGSRVPADVIVVLDVSKSMLAEDASPNRLERAKVEIAAMASRLRGHRLGLVAFAGRAALLCPLTPDQAFFDLVRSEIDTSSVSRGGTRIGDAVRTAIRGFPPGPGAKLIVLITDGEDHESDPLDAAAAARDAGVRIVAVGIGSEEGSEIVVTNPQTGQKSPMLHDGAPVISRLDGETLREMAGTTDGVYIPAGTSALDLEGIVREHVEPIVREETDAATRVIPVERYPWLVFLAIACLVAAAIVGAGAGSRGPAAAAVLLVLIASCTQGDYRAARGTYNDGVKALAAGEFDRAVELLLEARSGAVGDSELRARAAFNLGLAYAGQAEQARTAEPPDQEGALQHFRTAAAWFQDAIRQRGGEDQESRVNLEIVLARAQAIADELAADEKTLERKLERLIDGQREVRDQARVLLQAARAASAASPTAYEEAARQLATAERTLLADAGVVLDLAGGELDRIEGTPEDQRQERDQVRQWQLTNLDQWIAAARTAIADTRRLLDRVVLEDAHQRAEEAVDGLKRAREQLLDPGEVLRGLATDQLEVLQQTAYLDDAAPKLGQVDDAAPAQVPAWLTAAHLGGRQTDLESRLEELAGRLRPVENERVKTALPELDAALAAMTRARDALTTSALPAAVAAETQALAALTRAIEQFLDLRRVIDLAWGEQGQIVGSIEQDQDVTEAIARNVRRMSHLKRLIEEEKAKAMQPQEGQPPPEPGADQIYAQAETLRAEAEAAMGRPGLEGAREAHARLEELRELFFSIVEHLAELIRQQGETRDDTTEAVGLDDFGRAPLLPGLTTRQGEHRAMAQAIADALAQQADAAAQAPPDPQQPAPRFGEAAEEVRAAIGDMDSASGLLEKAQAPDQTVSFDLAPTLDDQQSAIDHLEAALRILRPPQDQPQDQPQQDEQQQQQQQQDQSVDQRRQSVREDEARQRREQQQRARGGDTPVEKDW